MNKEWLMILAMGVGGIAGAAGGTGYKWARRFLLPVVLGVLAILGGYTWWIGLVYIVAQIAAMHLISWGESTPYWRRLLAGLVIALPTLILGFTPWLIVVAVAFPIMYILSNTTISSKYMPWKVVEFSIFMLLGTCVANLISLK